MKRYIATAYVLLLAFGASAQNLNPTVQVTNAYDTKLMDISKKDLAMNVPDSLFRFDWNFDYSVFENPYKGAYEFNPYVIDMKPDPSVYDGTNLYLRAGLGYSFHPEAKLVWTPKTKGAFSASVYDDFKGYLGNYSEIVSMVDDRESAQSSPIDMLKLWKTDNVYQGMDMANTFGTALRYDAGKAVVSLDGKFNWIGSRGYEECDVNNVLGTGAVLSVRSNTPQSRFFYDLSADGSFLSNNNDIMGVKFQESTYGLETGLGYWFSAGHAAVLDTDLDWNRFIKDREYSDEGIRYTGVNVAPMYRFSYDRFSLSAGIRFSNVSHDYVGEPAMIVDYGVSESGTKDKVRKLFPHFSFSYEAVEDALVVTASLRGGQKINTYSSFLESNHLLLYNVSNEYGTGVSVNTFDANLAFSGRLGRHFQYRLDGGYARWLDSPFEGLFYAGVDPHGHGSAAYIYMDICDYDLLYAGFDGKWSSDRFDAAALLKVQHADFKRYMYCEGAATLPAFSGFIDARYNWNRRVFAGLSLEWATGRRTADYEGGKYYYQHPYECRIPGWVDLGLNLEYKFNSRLSGWVKGGNLLGQTCQRNLFIAEKGPYFTLGVCLGL